MFRPKHYWRKRLHATQPHLREASVCDANGTIQQLSFKPQPSLTWLARWLAFLTTPFKRLGISGWQETGCVAQTRGRPVRPAQHSTDGFWTIDVDLLSFRIGAAHAPSGRFLRVEVEPGTAAHGICEKEAVGPPTLLSIGGPVVIDTDGPFLEVHPDEDFHIEGH